MPSRNTEVDDLSRSRSPSPSDSFDSFDSTLSSSSTLCSPTATSSPPVTPISTIVVTPPSMYSSSGLRPRRLTPPQRLLGAIDEDSPTVQPDLPFSTRHDNNPMTKLHVYAAVVNSKHKQTLARTSSPHSSEFDLIMGPNGERFTDLRMNRKLRVAKGWKKFMCFGR